ncbi:MAG: SDR family oxidoreductase [Verrucomicrobiae bacterium]|nr:SDR family oxidoreductase [Verrucomicrobiae bacterium]
MRLDKPAVCALLRAAFEVLGLESNVTSSQQEYSVALSELKGRWALILGASSGFGAATALELARYGMNIFGIHLDRRSAAQRVRDLITEIEQQGVQVHYLNMNIARDDKRAEALATIKNVLASKPNGPQTLHLVMHSVAFGSLGPLVSPRSGEAITISQLEGTLDVMAHSLVYWVRELWCAGLLARGSRVFSMTSSGSSRAFEGYGAVSAAKAVLESHTRQLALELGRHGVMVNCIMAGVTDTPALRKIPGYENLMAHALQRNPGGRLTTPEDVAKTIRALSDPEVCWINGAVIAVDGGEFIAS